jgi:SAM-dependent methyltransferase
MCGTGTLLPDLLLRYRTVIGIDLSVPMLRERLCGAVACADAEALPFAAGSFDAVIVRGALHHIHPITDALAEIHAVLKPGGTLVLCEPCDDFPLVRWARRAMYRWMPYFGKEERTFRSRDLRRQLEAAGFTVTASARFGFLAYAVLGFPDIVPALAPLQRLPPRCLQWLCACDRWLAGVPIVKDWSLVYLVACEVS